MALQVDDGQHAGLGLEPEHALVGSLVLPRAGADEGGATEIQALMAVNVAGHKDIGDLADDQTVLGFG